MAGCSAGGASAATDAVWAGAVLAKGSSVPLGAGVALVVVWSVVGNGSFGFGASLSAASSMSICIAAVSCVVGVSVLADICTLVASAGSVTTRVVTALSVGDVLLSEDLSVSARVVTLLVGSSVASGAAAVSILAASVPFTGSDNACANAPFCGFFSMSIFVDAAATTGSVFLEFSGAAVMAVGTSASATGTATGPVGAGVTPFRMSVSAPFIVAFGIIWAAVLLGDP